MAEFCSQCSIYFLGEDFEDFKTPSDPGYVPLGPGQGWAVICEGCGPTMVDNEGRCIDPNCLYHHGEEIAGEIYPFSGESEL